jgi:hypothetical protein
MASGLRRNQEDIQLAMIVFSGKLQRRNRYVLSGDGARREANLAGFTSCEPGIGGKWLEPIV